MTHYNFKEIVPKAGDIIAKVSLNFPIFFDKLPDSSVDTQNELIEKLTFQFNLLNKELLPIIKEYEKNNKVKINTFLLNHDDYGIKYFNEIILNYVNECFFFHRQTTHKYYCISLSVALMDSIDKTKEQENELHCFLYCFLAELNIENQQEKITRYLNYTDTTKALEETTLKALEPFCKKV